MADILDKDITELSLEWHVITGDTWEGAILSLRCQSVELSRRSRKTDSKHRSFNDTIFIVLPAAQVDRFMMIALADDGAVVTIFRFKNGTQRVTFRIEYQTDTSIVVQLLYDGCSTTVGRNEECATVWSLIDIGSIFLTRLWLAFTLLILFHQLLGSFTQFVMDGSHNLATIFQRAFAHTGIGHNKEV